MDMLVSTDWLARELGASDLRIVDATYFALDPTRDPAADHAAAHIPGALFLDLASLKDDANPLPGMLPSEDRFARHVGSLGIGRDDRIILYDNSPHRTAARAWFMFRMFGAKQVALLDGGLGKWLAEQRPVEVGRVSSVPGRFAAVRDGSRVRDLGQMRANLGSGAEQVVDARSRARFTGEEPDPRGLAPGHIPRSRSLPYGDLLRPDGSFKEADELRDAFIGAGVDLSRPIVTTCGSGVTAAIIAFAAALLGHEEAALYDGSWSEWGLREDTEKEIGAPCTTTMTATD